MTNKRGKEKKNMKIFLNFTYPHKTQPEQKLQEISRIFLKMFSHQMFGYPGLDAGLNTSRFAGDIAFSDKQNRPRLAKSCLCHFK